VGLVYDHARLIIEEGKDEAISGPDETLLRLLADAVRTGENINLSPSELLDRARQEDSNTFQRWRPATVGRTLKRYGIQSTPGNRRTYREVTVDSLRRVSLHYGVDLGLPTESPSCPSSSVIQGQAPNGAALTDMTGMTVMTDVEKE